MVPLSPEFLRLLAVVAVLNLPVYALIWFGLFGDWDDFTAAVYFWFSPNWLDWVRGDSDEDAWQHAKLMVFLVLGGLLVVSESVNIQHKLPGLATTLIGWGGGAPVPQASPNSTEKNSPRRRGDTEKKGVQIRRASDQISF